MTRWIPRSLFLFFFASLLPAAEPNVTRSDAISVKQSLDRLSVTGSVLMIAAHPDDENTALISYLARGRNVRTAYLSLTRGEGGQNVIGPETGADLGVIRTEELLQSRRVDGAQQFFSRAIDFGFSKSAKEAIEKWGHDQVLGDIVWVIRKFRPDVVVLQFTGTPKDGHGQHQASSILGREAFDAAADPSRYPEQLKYVRPWRAERLMMNRRGWSPEMQKEIAALPDKIDLELGKYNPLLGYSYGELAGISRSFNSSQSDGTPRLRGETSTALVTVKGPVAKTDLFDGVDLTWSRYGSAGSEVAHLLSDTIHRWNPEAPWELIPSLAHIRELASKIDDPAAQDKIKDIDEAITQCAGLWLDFTASAQDVVAGQPFKERVTAIRRTSVPVTILSLAVNGKPFGKAQEAVLEENKPLVLEDQHTIPENRYTQPYWLVQRPNHDRYAVEDLTLTGLPENPAPLRLEAKLRIGKTPVTVQRDCIYRYIDRLSGESIAPVAFIPRVSLRIVQPNLVFTTNTARTVQVEVTSHVAKAQGTVKLRGPANWSISPREASVSLTSEGEQRLLTFTVQPGAQAESGDLFASVESGGTVTDVAVQKIGYPHIPTQTLFPKAETKLVRTDAVTLAKNIGYIMGSGDAVPEALRQLGCNVEILNAGDLARGDLSRYDAIVTGIRAFTERPDLVANEPRLLDYVAQGGTLVVQYNRIERNSENILNHMGPYPFNIGNLRVTVEDSPVKFDADTPLLNRPNKISSADFTGWIQERGLYFASKWDDRYHPLFEMQDPGESPLRGSTLVARYGKGVYVFTALSWFRELPAGVPGAYRIFANLLSASKTLGGEATAANAERSR